MLTKKAQLFKSMPFIVGKHRQASHTHTAQLPVFS
jgi:hypothetical protein